MSVKIIRKKKTKLSVKEEGLNSQKNSILKKEVQSNDFIKDKMLETISLACEVITFCSECTAMSNDKNIDIQELESQIRHYCNLFGTKKSGIINLLSHAIKLIGEVKKISAALNIDLSFNEKDYEKELDSEVISDNDLEVITTLVNEFGMDVFNIKKQIDDKFSSQKQKEKIIDKESFIMKTHFD